MTVTTTKKLVAVLGATGAQGGSVARELLNKYKDKYTVRVLSRNTSSAKAQELVKLGAEAVACDVNKKQDLERAFDGAYAVFAVTQFWDEAEIKAKGPEFELEQGKAITDVAKAKGVQHLVWSSLDDVDAISKHTLPHVYHFTVKNKVEQYIQQQGVPATFFYPAAYMSNFFAFPGFKAAKNAETGSYEIKMPVAADRVLPIIDIEVDTGRIVAAILENRDRVLGKRVDGVSDNLTMAQIAQAISQHTGQKVEYKFTGELSDDQVKSMDFMTREMTEMLLWFHRYGYYGGRDVSETAKLVPGLVTFAQFLDRTKPKLE